MAPKGKSKAKAKTKAKAKAKSEPSSASTPKPAETKAAVMKRPSALRTPRKDAEPEKFWDDEQEEPKPPAKKVVKRPAAQTSEEGQNDLAFIDLEFITLLHLDCLFWLKFQINFTLSLGFCDSLHFRPQSIEPDVVQVFEHIWHSS